MQERVRAVEFVLSRCGLEAATGVGAGARTVVAQTALRAVESWPHALVPAPLARDPEA